jgi:isochorismate synthase
MESEFLDKVKQLIDDQLPFFMLRRKGEQQVRLLHQQDQKLHKKPHDKMAYASFSKFEINDNQYFIHGEIDKSFKFKFASNQMIFIDHKTDLGSDLSRIQHIDLVDKAIQQLEKGSLKKVVLSRKQKINGDFNPVTVIQNLLNTYPEANCYFWFHPEVGQWCGATPELLLEYSGNILHTMSLAGTMKKTETGDVIWGDKEKEEQQIVTDSIVKDLHLVGVDSIMIGDQKTVTAGNLLHLQSDIRATISQKTVTDYLKVLHPTPAVCGLPKKAALQYILDHEGYDRSFYSGYLGLTDHGNHKYFVNLRCMQLVDDGAILYAGGGITAKSIAEDEYQETVNKMQTMSQLLH